MTKFLLCEVAMQQFYPEIRCFPPPPIISATLLASVEDSSAKIRWSGLNPDFFKKRSQWCDAPCRPVSALTVYCHPLLPSVSDCFVVD
jgi:hypothetical protein